MLATTESHRSSKNPLYTAGSSFSSADFLVCTTQPSVPTQGEHSDSMQGSWETKISGSQGRSSEND